MKIENMFGRRGSNLRMMWNLLVVMPCIFFAITVLLSGCSSKAVPERIQLPDSAHVREYIEGSIVSMPVGEYPFVVIGNMSPIAETRSVALLPLWKRASIVSALVPESISAKVGVGDTVKAFLVFTDPDRRDKIFIVRLK